MSGSLDGALPREVHRKAPDSDTPTALAETTGVTTGPRLLPVATMPTTAAATPATPAAVRPTKRPKSRFFLALSGPNA